MRANFEEEQKIDLNDLLKRAKEQKKAERKTNVLIFSGALSIAFIIAVVLY